MMRRLIFTFAQLFLLLFIPMVIVLSTQVSAVDVLPVCDKGATAANTDICKSVDPGTAGNNPIIRILRVAIQLISAIIGFAAVIIIIISGLSLITANGDAGAVAKARTGIIYALIGLVVAALAQVIVAFVLNKL